MELFKERGILTVEILSNGEKIITNQAKQPVLKVRLKLENGESFELRGFRLSPDKQHVLPVSTRSQKGWVIEVADLPEGVKAAIVQKVREEGW